MAAWAWASRIARTRLVLGVHELAMDDVVATAHDKHRRPITGSQQDYAENNNL